MAFQRPTLTALITRIEADYVSRLTGGGTLLRRSVARVLARIHAGAMHLLYGFGDFISKQIIPDTASAEFLARWAAIWGIIRIAATYTTFDATFTGTDGTVIPIGTELASDDGTLYVTTAIGTIAAGEATVACTAVLSGSATGLDGGELLSLSSPIAGIGSQATVEASGINDGDDQEDDDALLARLLARIQNPPQGGAETDYEAWALEVAGVTRAWVYPLYLGAGTVGVTFVRDDDVSIIPDGTEVTEVQDHIDGVRPVTAVVTVFAPTAVPLNFTISGISNVTVRAAVEAELEDLIRREAEPAGTLLLSHIQQAISNTAGEEDHALTAPATNVTTTAGQLTTMGTITWL
jgi:uncharacterized phage protein gp47/JayE